MMTPRQKIEDFFTAFAAREYKKSEILLSPSEKPKGIYYLKHGQVRQYDISGSGNVLVVNLFKPGAHFPMSWAINNEENLWYFEADTDCTLHIAPKEEALDFFKSDSAVLYDFVERLCSGATGQQRRLAHLMGGGAYTRVLYELTVQLKRFGVQDGEQVCVALSESALGRSAGLSREAVSRELGKLKKQGLITTGYRKMCTKTVKALEQELDMLI